MLAAMNHTGFSALAGVVGVLALAGCAATELKSSDTPRGFIPRSLALAGEDHKYTVYVPPGLDLSKPQPLIVFLHGSGECGTDNEAHLRVGLPRSLREHPERWPAIVMLPQKPRKDREWEDYDSMVMGQLSSVLADYRVDEDRIVLTGLSQGGHGTWVLGSRHAEVWAGLAPVCGYGRPGEIVDRIVKLPVWAFHGGKDNVVPPAQTSELITQLSEAGSTRVKYTLYPDADHNSWDAAYGDPKTAEWMFAVRRGR